MHTVLTVDQMIELQEIAGIYSDIYKDYYGLRPRDCERPPHEIHEYYAEIRRISDMIVMEKAERIKRRKRLSKLKRELYRSRPINYPFTDLDKML